jgi:WD40 repeat protein
LVTGHRGFNAAGSEVKIWDLRKFEQPTSIFKNHAFTPESVRFLDHEKPIVVSAAKDSCLNVIDGDGQQLQSERNSDAFACMDMLKPPRNDTHVVVCADIK